MKKSPSVNRVTLNIVPGTNLYQSATRGAGENRLFLRWDTNDPPQSLTLEDTWDETGSPNLGYFVFLNTLPATPDAGTFEQDLRKAVPAPAHTGFVWAVYTAGASHSAVSVQTLLRIRPNASQIPCVDGNTLFNVWFGALEVGFGDGSPVIATDTDGCITGFSITYPPVAGADPPQGPGVALPMTGTGVGCVQFVGLTNALGGPRATRPVRERRSC